MSSISFEVVSVYLVALVNIATAGRFVYLIIKQRIQPALAMWLFFLLAIATSLITYIKDGGFTPLDNILNTTDVLLALSITGAIMIYGNKGSMFNKFDMACLSVVVVIMIFWLFTGAHFLTNLMIQMILVIAYFPVIQRMITAGRNTESFSGWIGMLLAACLSLFSLKGDLAFIYAYRAIISVTMLLALMLYFELKDRAAKGGQ